jgi:hypothetical protein
LVDGAADYIIPELRGDEQGGTAVAAVAAR